MSLFFDKGSLPEAGRPLWYALQVWSRKETSVSIHLQSLGYEFFLPTYKCQRQWSDRVKELEQPLFPGYLFCRFDFQNRRPDFVQAFLDHLINWDFVAQNLAKAG